MLKIFENKILYTAQIETFFNAPVLSILVLIILFFRRVFSRIILKITFKIFQMEYTDKNNLVLNFLNFYIINVGLYFLILIWSRNLVFIENVERYIKILTVFAIALLICSVLRPENILFRKNNENKESKKEQDYSFLINNFILKIIKGIVVVIAIFVSLTILKININGLVTGLGISSAIIALAVQDVFKNIIAGTTIIAEKTFEIGDTIKFDGQVGQIEDITLRSTKIRTKSNSIIGVPNYKMATEIIENISSIKTRRIEFSIMLPYYLSAKEIHRIIEKIKMILDNNSKIIQNSGVVTLNEITDFAYGVLVYCYINESRYVQYLEIQQRIYMEIIDMLNIENIDFAKPVQQLEIEKNKRREIRTKDKNLLSNLLGNEKKEKEETKYNIRNI